MHKKFEINRTKIKDSRQSGRKVVTHDSKSDLPLNNSKMKSAHIYIFWKIIKMHQLVLVHSAKIANEQKTLEA